MLPDMRCEIPSVTQVWQPLREYQRNNSSVSLLHSGEARSWVRGRGMGGGRGEVGGRGGEPKLELAGSQSAQPGTGRQYRTGPAPPALVKSLLLCFETRDPPGDFTYLCSIAPCKWRSSPWRTKYRKIYGRWMNIIWMKAMICFIILWDNVMWNVSAPSLHGCSPTGFCAN